jgi:hypothetical protein
VVIPNTVYLAVAGVLLDPTKGAAANAM